MNKSGAQRWPVLDVLVMLIVFVIASIALLAIVPTWPKVVEWASDKDAPAWVQAVGSIVAIFAAALIAAWQNGRSERNERRKIHQQSYARLKVILSILKRIDFIYGLIANKHEQPRNKVWSLYQNEVVRLREIIAKLPMFEIGDPDLVLAVTNSDLGLSLVFQMMEGWMDDSKIEAHYKSTVKSFAGVLEAHKIRLDWCTKQDKTYSDNNFEY